MTLAEAVERLLASRRPHFAQAQTFERGGGRAFSSLVTFGRHTVTRLNWGKNEQGRNCSADHRIYSKRRWDVDPLFFEVLKAADTHGDWPRQDVLVALDDRARCKTGKKAPRVRTLHDPMSLP